MLELDLTSCTFVSKNSYSCCRSCTPEIRSVLGSLHSRNFSIITYQSKCVRVERGSQSLSKPLSQLGVNLKWSLCTYLLNYILTQVDFRISPVSIYLTFPVDRNGLRIKSGFLSRSQRNCIILYITYFNHSLRFSSYCRYNLGLSIIQ